MERLSLGISVGKNIDEFSLTITLTFFLFSDIPSRLILSFTYENISIFLFFPSFFLYILNITRFFSFFLFFKHHPILSFFLSFFLVQNHQTFYSFVYLFIYLFIYLTMSPKYFFFSFFPFFSFI